MMGKIWRILLLAMLINAPLATMSLARPVYLADGGIIEAQRVWQEEGEVFVLLNRDSLITFSPEQLNLKKTFAKKWHKAPAKPASKRIKTRTQVAPVVGAAPVTNKLPEKAAAVAPAAKSAAPASPPVKVAPKP